MLRIQPIQTVAKTPAQLVLVGLTNDRVPCDRSNVVPTVRQTGSKTRYDAPQTTIGDRAAVQPIPALDALRGRSDRPARFNRLAVLDFTVDALGKVHADTKLTAYALHTNKLRPEPVASCEAGQVKSSRVNRVRAAILIHDWSVKC